jgi:hypothetical protein
VDVLFRTGSVVHSLPEPAATLLAENLRANPIEGDVSRTAADRIERFLVGETREPIQFADDERVAVQEVLEVIMAGPYDSPTLRELSSRLGSEWLGGS